jgi:bacterioferritin (cytochrome b1)
MRKRLPRGSGILEGTPTAQPAPIKVGDSLKEFLELDVKAEEDAITLYKKIIDQAQKETDVTTASYLKKSLKTKKSITIFLLRCSKRCETHLG